jgi:hypothetical protein
VISFLEITAFGCILPVAEFRLYFDLEHSSTHSVDF